MFFNMWNPNQPDIRNLRMLMVMNIEHSCSFCSLFLVNICFIFFFFQSFLKCFVRNLFFAKSCPFMDGVMPPRANQTILCMEKRTSFCSHIEKQKWSGIEENSSLSPCSGHWILKGSLLGRIPPPRCKERKIT